MADTSALHSTLLLTPKWPRKLGFAIGSLSVRCFLKRGNRVAGRVQQPTPRSPSPEAGQRGNKALLSYAPHAEKKATWRLHLPGVKLPDLSGD